METRSAPARRDPKAMLEKVNVHDAFAKTVGIRVVELLPGYAKALMEVTDHHLNLFRMIHGRVISPSPIAPARRREIASVNRQERSKTTSISY